jgi:poly-gamma-glutamate synthesis protein (capsule biosynthesis protein)
MKGRPGVNLIRWINEWVVDEAAFEALERVARQFGWRQRVAGWLTRAYGLEEDAAEDITYFLDRNSLGVGTEDPAARFVRGDAFERHTRIHRFDLERNLQSVREACRMADWVIFAMHNHEGAHKVDEPSEHVRALAHAVLDAGADVFVGHGPHLDRGIEVYNGKPIVYGLGNFIIQNDTVARVPQDAMVVHGLAYDSTPADFYDARRPPAARRPSDGTDPHYQSAVVVVSFKGDTLREIALHPIEFGHGLPRSQAGRPVLATGAGARETLERFQRLSAPFGTQVAIEGDTGVVRPG